MNLPTMGHKIRTIFAFQVVYLWLPSIICMYRHDHIFLRQEVCYMFLHTSRHTNMHTLFTLTLDKKMIFQIGFRFVEHYFYISENTSRIIAFRQTFRKHHSESSATGYWFRDWQEQRPEASTTARRSSFKSEAARGKGFYRVHRKPRLLSTLFKRLYLEKGTAGDRVWRVENVCRIRRYRRAWAASRVWGIGRYRSMCREESVRRMGQYRRVCDVWRVCLMGR